MLVRDNSVAASESAVVYLYAALSQHMQRAVTTDAVAVHVNTQRNAALLDRLLAAGCRVSRHTMLLVHGEYVPPHRYVHCSSYLW